MDRADRVEAGWQSLASTATRRCELRRNTGVNTLTGEGLAEALEVGSGRGGRVELLVVLRRRRGARLLLSSTTNLPQYSAKAGVGEAFTPSGAVGGRHPRRLAQSGYFRVKIVQEQLTGELGRLYSLVHATQFFEFVKAIVLHLEERSMARSILAVGSRYPAHGVGLRRRRGRPGCGGGAVERVLRYRPPPAVPARRAGRARASRRRATRARPSPTSRPARLRCAAQRAHPGPRPGLQLGEVPPSRWLAQQRTQAERTRRAAAAAVAGSPPRGAGSTFNAGGGLNVPIR